LTTINTRKESPFAKQEAVAIEESSEQQQQQQPREEEIY
jgi:hypothetical protein